MSEFDVAAADMDSALFDAFGEDVTAQRGTDVPLLLRAFVVRGVAKYGELGQVVGRVTTVSFINAEWQPQVGDVVTTTTGPRAVESIDTDDGFVTRAVLRAY